jgi:predicted DNA-binding protein (MmcQ/YjbR family)
MRDQLTANDIKEYCLKKADAYMDLPFGEIPICFKVNNKIFCELYPKENDYKITLKCEPFLATLLREKYKSDIIRGYHCPLRMQPYRNTVYINKSVPKEEILKMIDHSYNEVICK